MYHIFSRWYITLILWSIISLSCNINYDTQKESSGEPEKADSVAVTIDWNYKSLPTKMEIREPSALRSIDLWTTDSIRDIQNAPFSNIIEENTFYLSPGGKKSFILTMTNTTRDDLYFFAAPHLASPVEHSLGFKFKCLCVNHVFHIPPGNTWYRAVEFRLSEHFLGAKLTVTHTLLGTTKDRLGD